MLLLLLLVAGVTNTLAQNVTVRSNNGSTIAAVKNSSAAGTAEDTFFSLGGFAMWKHNQLNLTMTTADADGATLSDNGQFMNPANNIFKATGNATNLQLGRGNLSDCYVAFTLPKGYRFTKYTIVFRRNIDLGQGGDGNAEFGEANPTNSWNWYNNNTHVTGLSYSTSAQKSTISRTSLSDDDMDNTLYFKLTNNSRAFISLESVEFEFTAEADYTPVSPVGAPKNKRAVDIPFSTSTVDIGSVANRTYNGTTRISYTYANVKPQMANLTLFEEEAVKSGTNYDGISGDVVDYDGTGTISAEGDYFKLGGVKGSDGKYKEQVYYLETPTYVEEDNNARTKNPIGYRIVGAKIKYTYGQKRENSVTKTETKKVLVDSKSYPTFYIQGVYDGIMSNTTVYLTNGASASTRQADRAEWFMDDDGYIRLAEDPDTYLKQGSNNRLIIASLKERPAVYSFNGNYIRSYNQNVYVGRSGGFGNYTYYFAAGSTTSNRATHPSTGKTQNVNIYEDQTTTVTYEPFTPSTFTLNVYKNDGSLLVSKEVKQGTEDDFIEIPDLNNDAVKFGVIGVGLVQAELTLQALDPYINRMSIVCSEAQQNSTSGLYEPTGNGLALTQTFTASDFTVSGQAFHFYIPKDFKAPCLFTFENLYSDYGDNTYYERASSTNNARYSFVKSPYWDDAQDLYATTYDPDHEYDDKVYTLVKGTQAFTFNNAGTVGTSGGVYHEYPFSLEKYTTEGGDFDQLYFTQTEMAAPQPGQTATQKTAYLFTCDETRYNISKATATQHRTYAFYEMKVTAQRQDYEAKLEWTEIYEENKTLYKDGNTVKKDAQYGLTLKAVDSEDHTTEVPGYLTVSQVLTGIQSALNTTGAPKTKDQILYIDASHLLSIVENSETPEGSTTPVRHSLSEIKNGLGANALIFLPLGQQTSAGTGSGSGSGSGSGTTPTVSYTNFATKTKSGTFSGAGNFVLTDMKPFYSPYDIYLPSANTAEYKRMITKSTYGQETTSTIILPFDILVTEGKHTNLDGSQFTLHKMQATNSLVLKDGTTYAYMPNAFSNVTTTTEQNKPYIVKLDEKYTEDTNLSFVVTQNGATIKATTGIMNADYTITDKDAEGKVITSTGTATTGEAEGKYTFTNKGTYAGIEIDKGQDVFYFARNNFVCSKSLNDNYSTVKVAPFRAFYTSEAVGAAKLMSFDMIFSEGLGDTPTGISSLNANPDLKVVPGNGVITMTSAIEQNVRVNSTSGVLVSNAKLQAGETQIINVPAGVYVINGVKIIVK